MKKILALLTILFVPLLLFPQGKRVALLIGNSNYQAGAPLSNPVNDATDLAELLKSTGFEVQSYMDLDQASMKRVIDQFGTSLNEAEVGLFFYAGHGVQAKGKNYLIPIDASLKTENDVEYNCVDAGRILAKMEDANTSTNIVILDACRNNPFERSWSRNSQGNGLASMNAPSGSLIAYSTAPGKTAADGYYRNSPYTSALLKYIGTPNLQIEALNKLVRNEVMDNTNGEQEPWESTSLRGEFCFVADQDYIPADNPAEDLDLALADTQTEHDNTDPSRRRSTLEENRKKLATGIRSLAILPFADYTGDDSKGYFAAGMHDALISELGQLGLVRVTSKTSTLKYADFQNTIQEIAAELNVDGVIETSLIGIGEDLRIQVKLYSAFPQEQMLWSEVFTSEMSDILYLYNQVTKNIADEIQLSLTPEKENYLGESRKIEPDAYDAYLKGQYYWEMLHPDSIQLAMESFELAVQKEPEWADPYVGLANTWLLFGNQGTLPTSITIPNMVRNLKRAMELDPGSAQAHYGNAIYAVWTNWNWELGEAEFLKTIEINPNDALARLYYAHLLMILHRYDEAVQQADIGMALDPLRPLVLMLYSIAMEATGNYQAAITVLEKNRELGSALGSKGSTLQAYYLIGDYERWIQDWENKVRNGWNDTAIENVVNAFHEKGHIAAVEEMFKMNKKYGNGPGGALMTNNLKARRALYLNKPEDALDYLEEAFNSNEDRLGGAYIGSGTYIYEKLKSYPRYIELLRKMNLPLPANE